MQTKRYFYGVPYFLWIVLFVILPLLFIFFQSFLTTGGQLTFENYVAYFSSKTYLLMTLNSFLYAGLITLVTLFIAYPTAYFLAQSQQRDLLVLLIILPTWVNLLLKAYAFIGILGRTGSVNNFLSWFGLGPFQLLFTDGAFLAVSSYIELPFMILPILNSLMEIDGNLIHASYDLGATRWDTFRRVIFPLSKSGVRSGVQAVFIPSLSLFMLTRLIGGNKIITLGTAIEQHFLVTQNWGMGATIGVVLIIFMFLILFATEWNHKGLRSLQQRGGGK